MIDEICQQCPILDGIIKNHPGVPVRCEIDPKKCQYHKDKLKEKVLG
jgi:hypothetical protein